MRSTWIDTLMRGLAARTRYESPHRQRIDNVFFADQAGCQLACCFADAGGLLDAMPSPSSNDCQIARVGRRKSEPMSGKSASEKQNMAKAPTQTRPRQRRAQPSRRE